MRHSELTGTRLAASGSGRMSDRSTTRKECDNHTNKDQQRKRQITRRRSLGDKHSSAEQTFDLRLRLSAARREHLQCAAIERPL